MHGATTGVGSALRKARQTRGVTIDEASRDTRIRPELLRALEAEEFDRLLGEVYVRGALRSYSSYLGLPPDRVISAYARLAGDDAPTPQPPPSNEPVIGALRRRDNHRLLLMVAATVVVVAAAFGVLSTRESAPQPARLPDTTQTSRTRPIQAGLTALQEVEVTVVVDGIAQDITLHEGESRAFTAVESMRIKLFRGGVTNVVVNGNDLGYPGDYDQPWARSFSYETSPAPTPGA